MARYLGDARAGFTATAAGVEGRLRVVNDTSAMADRSGYEANAGTAITFFYKRIVTTNPPNKVTIQVRRDNDNTVLQTFLTAGAEPADGASFSYTNANAGPVRLYLLLVKDNSSGNLTNYSVDSDGTFGTFGTGLLLPSGIADAGCLRGNMLVSALAPTSAGPFQNNDTINPTATHTAAITGLSSNSVKLDILTAADAVQSAGSSVAIDAGTSFVRTQVGGSNYAAGSAAYGLLFSPTTNAAFVPTSGAILWTKMIASGGSTVQSGDNVKRSNFYTVNPNLNIHSHTTKSAVFNAASADDTAYVILGDTVNWWARVNKADNSTPLNTTSGNNVSVIIKTPSGATNQTNTFDTAPVASNSNTNGWGPAFAFSPTSPAGNWSWNASVTFNGITATEVVPITFITPLTSNLATRLIHPVLMKPGQTVRAYFQSEVDDVAATPQALPTYKYGPLPDLSPIANQAAWYRFNTGITSSGGFVSQWADQSGNSRHLLQAVATKQPALQGDGSILFDGIDNVLKTAAFTLNQPMTIYLLFRQVTWTQFDYIFDGDTADDCVLWQRSGSVSPEITIYAGTNVATNSNLAINTYGSVAAVFNGASSSLLVNATTETTGNAGTNNAGGFTLGTRGDAVEFFSNIQVKEVLIYSAAHSAAQRAAVIAYLNSIGGPIPQVTGNMLNDVDNTATINGANYHFDITAPATEGRYNVFTQAQLNGNGIRGNWTFRVADDEFNPLGKLFSGPG